MSKNSKNVDFDCIMNAFFVERKKLRIVYAYHIHRAQYSCLKVMMAKSVRAFEQHSARGSLWGIPLKVDVILKIARFNS